MAAPMRRVLYGLLLTAAFASTLSADASAAERCDQCPGCRPGPVPGAPENCTDRLACLARCTVSGAVDSTADAAAKLDEARRSAMSRLQQDEAAALAQIEAELKNQRASVAKAAADARNVLDSAVEGAATRVRNEIAARVAEAKARSERRASAIGRQMAAAQACLKTPLPAAVSETYGEAASWLRRTAARVDTQGRARAVGAVEAGLAAARADAASATARISQRLTGITSPAQEVRSKAARIRSELKTLGNVDSLVNYARNGFSELRSSGASGVTAIRKEAQAAADALAALRSTATSRAQSLALQWSEQAQKAIASAARNTMMKDVRSLSRLRAQIRATGAGWQRVMSCVCLNADIVPPAEGNRFDWQTEAACVRPVREAPYEVALREHLSRRSIAGRFDPAVYERAAKHVRAMPAARLNPAALSSSSPGRIRQPLSVTGSGWEFVGPKNLGVPQQQYFGEGTVSGRVNAVAYDPQNPSVIYVGSAAGGLLRSKDRGSTWEPLSDSRRDASGVLTPGWPDLHVSAVAVAPNDSNTVYAGLGDFHGGLPFTGTGGVMKTSDGGLTWQNLGAAQFGRNAVSHILVVPENPQIVIATTATRVWRSVDGGLTWALAALSGGGTAPAGNWSGAAMGAIDPATKTRSYYVAGTALNTATPPVSAAVILRSDDQGATWTTLTAPTTGAELKFSVCASLADASTVYGLLTGGPTVWRSTDKGGTWTDLSPAAVSQADADNWRQNGYNYFLTCGRREGRDFLYLGFIDLMGSPDGGASWTSLGLSYTSDAKIHNDQHALAVHPTNPDEFLLGNDGGAYLGTLDSSHANRWDDFPSLFARFESLNAQLGITTFYSLAVHPSDPDVMLGGAQDNATPVSTGNLQQWGNTAGGDGGGVAISPVRPNIQYATTQGYAVSTPPPTPFVTLDFYRTDAGWEITSGPLRGTRMPQQRIPPFVAGDRLPFTPALELDPRDSRVLYTGTQFLWRLQDEFPLSPWRWSKVSSTALSTTNVIQAIAVAPSDRNTIYTASGDGEVWVSSDRGSNWTRIDNVPGSGICTPPTTPGGTPTCPGALSLSVNPADPNDVVVGFGLGGTATLFRATATNTSAPVWTSLVGAGTTALPVLPVNAIARDPRRADTIFVGNDAGVFVSEDNGATWLNAGTPFGLPNVRVTALRANQATDFLTAATFGRGIWRIRLSLMGLPSP